MIGRLSRLLRDYEHGCGFNRGEELQPREGANPFTYGVIDRRVVVLKQSPLAPHQYTVVGEGQNPRSPADRFVKFEINGHDWDRCK